MFISRNRVNELMELGQRAEDEELRSGILREIMEHYRKGIDYLTLLTEVNIAVELIDVLWHLYSPAITASSSAAVPGSTTPRSSLRASTAASGSI